jgi:hypothetical protein
MKLSKLLFWGILMTGMVISCNCAGFPWGDDEPEVVEIGADNVEVVGRVSDREWGKLIFGAGKTGEHGVSFMPPAGEWEFSLFLRNENRGVIRTPEALIMLDGDTLYKDFRVADRS